MKPKVRKTLHKLYNETGRQKVIETLFKYPDKEFSLSDLAREAGVAKANIGKILEQLYNLGMIELTKLTKIWRIMANVQNPAYIKFKIIYNLSIVCQSGLVDFLNDHFKNPKAIVLFGSFRKGEDITGSDIDIAIEMDSQKEYTTAEWEFDQLKAVIDRKIQVHLFNRKNVDINVFNNIANGIVLSGFLEVRP